MRVQELDVQEGLAAFWARLGIRRSLSTDGTGRRGDDARVVDLLLERAHVLGLLLQPRLRGRAALLRLGVHGLERDVTAVQVLLHVEQVLDRHLQQPEELAEVVLGEPVQIVLGEAAEGEVLEVGLEGVDVNLCETVRA